MVTPSYLSAIQKHEKEHMIIFVITAVLFILAVIIYFCILYRHNPKSKSS